MGASCPETAASATRAAVTAIAHLIKYIEGEIMMHTHDHKYVPGNSSVCQPTLFEFASTLVIHTTPKLITQ